MLVADWISTSPRYIGFLVKLYMPFVTMLDVLCGYLGSMVVFCFLKLSRAHISMTAAAAIRVSAVKVLKFESGSCVGKSLLKLQMISPKIIATTGGGIVK